MRGFGAKDALAGRSRDSGRVAVVYGTAAGIDLGRTTFWLPEANVALGHFGDAVAAADFDADGFSDLVVGHPGDLDGGALSNGSISVFMGATNGPTVARHRRIQPGHDAFPGQPANSLQFLRLAQLFLQVFALGDVNNLTDKMEGMAFGISGQRNLQQNMNNVAFFANITLFHLKVRYFTA